MQVAIHLIGGDVVEAEGLFARLRQARPVGAGGFQQAVGADDIGLDKRRRAVDGTVDMGFGGQVHDGVRLKLRQRGANRRLIDYIGLQELVARVIRDAGQGLQVTGVGQLVEVEHLVLGVVEQMADQCRANKARATGDQNTHENIALCY